MNLPSNSLFPVFHFFLLRLCTAVLRSNFSILSPFLPVCLFRSLMPVVLVLLSLWAVKKGRRDWKDMGTTKAAEWAAAGLGAQCVEWHLHFKRGRLNEPRHLFFFFTISDMFTSLVQPHPLSPSLCIRLSFSVSIHRRTLRIWGWYQVWNFGSNKGWSADTS